MPFSLRPAHADELQTLVAIDDDACELFVDAGLEFDFETDHPFVIAESERWAQSIDKKLAYVAIDTRGRALGFVVLRHVDSNPYVDQIAVHPSAMRQGIGTMLLRHAIAWSSGQPLWLTTYAHIPWNRPYYERHGFVVTGETECGPELLAILREQRAVLPEPGQRVAMVREYSSAADSSGDEDNCV